MDGKRLHLALAMALLACSLVACKTEPPSAQPAPPSSTRLPETGDRCSVAAECGDRLECHPERRVCICTKDEACPANLRCSPFTGLCTYDVPGCRSDADCDEDQWCHVSDRVCRARRSFCEPCEISEDCGAGNRCLFYDRGSFCGVACEGDDDCRPAGATSCVGGQCRATDGQCRGLAACTPDTLAACSRPEDCAEGQLCGPDGRCVAEDSGCRPLERCNELDLTCECDGDGSCGPGQRCVHRGERNECEAIPSCVIDTQCDEDEMCVRVAGATEGSCQPGCQESEGCPLGKICRVPTGAERGRCVLGCTTSEDCGPFETCEKAPGADTGSCAAAPGACQTTDACGTCEVCGAGGRCAFAFDAALPDRRYCETCGPDGLNPGDCGEGGYCQGGHCLVQCPTEGCPKGFTCRQISDLDGMSLGRVCAPNDGECDNECDR